MAIRVTEQDKLIIYDDDTGQILAEHPLCRHLKGELIRNKNHGRDRTKGIEAYVDHVAKQFSDIDAARRYIDELHKLKPRYIRDQLQAIDRCVSEANAKATDLALRYCFKHRLYRATDLIGAVTSCKWNMHSRMNNQPRTT